MTSSKFVFPYLFLVVTYVHYNGLFVMGLLSVDIRGYDLHSTVGKGGTL